MNVDKKEVAAESSPESHSKSSISIEVRKKDDGERPRTVKVFHSKLRSAGLEEAAKPAPPRSATKKPSRPLPLVPPKQASPANVLVSLPEKRVKLVEQELEKPGGIKLIAPKPKPQVLQESDMFMDALTASDTNKKKPKKRKRKCSQDNIVVSPPSSPTSTRTRLNALTISPLNPPPTLKSITAPVFNEDPLVTDDTKEKEDDETQDDKELTVEEAELDSPTDGEATTVIKDVKGLKGILVYYRKREIKKTVTWRPEDELEEIQYFELDENERVNVTKPFMDLKQMEHLGEREALQLSHKFLNEDMMGERTTWKALIPIDLPPPLANPGEKSIEKEIQFAREKVVLQTLYFSRLMLPDSPGEPISERHQFTVATPIPLEDITDNPEIVNDFRNIPWPEPKGSPLHQAAMNPDPPNISTLPPFNPQVMPPGFNVNQPFNHDTFIPPPPMNHGSGVACIPGGNWCNIQYPTGNMNPDPNHPPMNPNPNMFANPPGYMMDNNNNGNNDMGGQSAVCGFPPPRFRPPLIPHPPGHPGTIFPNYSVIRGGNNRGGYQTMGRGGWCRLDCPPPGWHRGGVKNHWGRRGSCNSQHFNINGLYQQRETFLYLHPQSNPGPY